LFGYDKSRIMSREAVIALVVLIGITAISAGYSTKFERTITIDDKIG